MIEPQQLIDQVKEATNAVDLEIAEAKDELCDLLHRTSEYIEDEEIIEKANVYHHAYLKRCGIMTIFLTELVAKAETRIGGLHGVVKRQADAERDEYLHSIGKKSKPKPKIATPPPPPSSNKEAKA